MQEEPTGRTRNTTVFTIIYWLAISVLSSIVLPYRFSKEHPCSFRVNNSSLTNFDIHLPLTIDLPSAVTATALQSILGTVTLNSSLLVFVFQTRISFFEDVTNTSEYPLYRKYIKSYFMKLFQLSGSNMLV